MAGEIRSQRGKVWRLKEENGIVLVEKVMTLTLRIQLSDVMALFNSIRVVRLHLADVTAFVAEGS
jgi:hypothetical protein